MRENCYHRYARAPEYEHFLDIVRSIDECRMCTLCDSPHVLYRGNPSARIALVGQCPGKKEHEKGIPWCGPAGYQMDRAFESVELDTNEDVFVTNIVKARPIAPQGSGRENRSS